MLGKLFKYEFRAVGKTCGFLLIVAFCVTILGAVYLLSPLFEGIVNPKGQMGEMGPGLSVISVILGILGLLSYAVMLIAISFGFTLWLSLRFYRSMYSDQGYLTHTLPVKPVHVLVAKVVTGGLCMLILSIALYAMVLFLVLLGAAKVLDLSMGELLHSFQVNVKFFLDVIKEQAGISFTGSGVIFLISLFLTPFTTVSIIFGSLTLGQYSWKNKGLMGIIAYLIVRVAMKFVSGIVGLAMTVLQISQPVGFASSVMRANGSSLGTLAINLIFAVALFFWSIHVVQNRLNLE